MAHAAAGRFVIVHEILEVVKGGIMEEFTIYTNTVLLMNDNIDTINLPSNFKAD